MHPVLRLLSALSLLIISFLQPASIFAESLTITTVVPANASSFPVSLNSDIFTSTSLEQNNIISYSISYGSTLATTTEVTLEASWTRGTVQGNTSPTVDVVSYVPGSASKGVDNVSPIIDVANQKIRWIVNLAPNSSYLVSFQLKTSGTLTSTNPVSFSAQARIIGPGFVTDESSLTHKYNVQPNQATPTPQPTIEPPQSPESAPSRPSAKPLLINSLELKEISPTTSTFMVSLTKPASITVLFGTKPQELYLSKNSTTVTPTHQLSLDQLKQSTRYYFQIIAIGETEIIRSDLYSFTTGQEAEVPQPIISSLVVASDNTILTNPLLTAVASSTAQIIIPVKSAYEFRIAVPNSQNISQIQAFLQNTVLGISFPLVYKDSVVSDRSIDLIEISSNIFAGKLVTPEDYGKYSLIVKIKDINGNIREKKVADVIVSRRFTLLDKKIRKPIDNARVVLSIFNIRSKQFEKLRPDTLSVANPQFSDSNGFINAVLPTGRYRAEITHLKYERKTVDFSVEEGGGYPEVVLTPSGFNPVNLGLYLISGITDVFYKITNSYLQALSQSPSIIDLASNLTIMVLIILFILALRTRLQIPFLRLPHYTSVMIKNGFRRNTSSELLSGRLIDSQTELPVKSAAVYLLDQTTHLLKEYAVTNAEGYFTLKGIMPNVYRVEVRKLGYHPIDLEREITDNTILNLALSPKQHTLPLIATIVHAIEQALQLAFEFILFFLIFLIFLNTITTFTLSSFFFLVLGFINLRIFLLYKNRQLRSLE